jgi:hypothetical protein
VYAIPGGLPVERQRRETRHAVTTIDNPPFASTALRDDRVRIDDPDGHRLWIGQNVAAEA